jgi:hypothetical protein
MPDLGDTGVSFNHVAREWRCKFTPGASGGPTDSTSLKAAQALLAEYLPKLKALPNAEVTRVVCGGCSDFKVSVNTPCADHDKWAAAEYAPEAEFIEKLKAIEGTVRVETQTYTCERM